MALTNAASFKELAHNGLLPALRDGAFLYRLGTRLRGLCALKEHAHNGVATALWDGVFLYRLATRLRSLCPWSAESLLRGCFAETQSAPA